MQLADHRLAGDSGGRSIEWRESPNVGGALSPTYLVMHYTAGGSAAESVRWLCDRRARASAHVVIGRDGTITQLVPFDRVAWHAGVSEWKGRSGLNAHAIGIELDNAGRLTSRGGAWRSWTGRAIPDDEVHVGAHRHDPDTSCGWHSFPEAQLEAAIDLAALLIDRYALREVLGHDDVSPGRKSDPGPAFPMGSFRGRLLGREADAEERWRTTTRLNIRSGAGTQHEPLPQSPLAKGTPVRVLDRRGSWCLVDVERSVRGANDVQGWVHGKFLAAE